MRWLLRRPKALALGVLMAAVMAATAPFTGYDALAGHDGLSISNGACFLLDGRGGPTDGTGRVVQRKHRVVGVCESGPVAPPEGKHQVVWSYKNTGLECSLPQGAGFTHTTTWRGTVRTVVDPVLGPVGIATLECSLERDAGNTGGADKPRKDKWPRR